MPYFAESCIDASKQGASKQRCGYPTRGWFVAWPSLESDSSFREEFCHRAQQRHIERLGFVQLRVKWPLEPRRIDGENESQVLEVACEWSREAVARSMPTSNVKGACPVCLESDLPVVCLTPCGHLVCSTCGPRFRRQDCPICRQHVSHVQSLYQAASGGGSGSGS